MSSTQVFQLDYQDFCELVWQHFELINEYQQDHGNFDMVLAKLKNGTIAASIIADYFQIPMGVIEVSNQTQDKNCRLFFPRECEEILKSGKKLNILFVDSICTTGKLIEEVKKYFKNHSRSNQINLATYCTLVDAKAEKKPDICGLLQEKFIQPPWEWRTFTPQAHLQRLEMGTEKMLLENKYSLGFCSDEVQQEIEDLLGKTYEFEWIQTFGDKDERIQSASGISSFSVPTKPITLEQGKTKFKNFINEKINFIKNNGLTHFIENDFVQALLISEKCPVCKILYFNNDELFRIYAKNFTTEQLLSLDLNL